MGPGGTDLERGYGDVRPWRPPFHASPAARKGPISSKRGSSQDSLLRKFGNFSLYSLNFRPNFSSQATKFGNFQITSPQIWKFSAHKPPFFRGKYQFASPTLQKSGPHTPTWKKLSAPRAMGTIMAPSYAIMFMAALEEHILRSCPSTPLVWWRYIDDVFWYGHILKRDLRNSCHTLINTTQPFNLLMKDYKVL